MWLTAGMALLSFAGSIFQASQTRSAQAAGKKQAKKITKANFERAVLEDDIIWEQQGSAWAWDMAKTEALKFQEKQKKSDYTHRTDALFEQALNNLQLNSSALYDKYGLEEGLRGTDAKLKLQEQIATNKDARLEAVGKSKVQKGQLNQARRKNIAEQAMVDFDYDIKRGNLMKQAKVNQLATTQQVFENLQGVKAKRRQQNILRQQLEEKGVNLREQDGLEMRQKLMERDMQSLGAAFESASTKASAAARSGGSATGRRLAMNAAQQFGRTYGQIRMLKQAQRARNYQYNAEVQGPRAKEMAQLAQDMQTLAKRSANAVESQKMRNSQLRREQLGIINRREQTLSTFEIGQKILGFQGQGIKNELKAAKNKLDLSYGTAKKNFKRLTLPSFDIAKRQGVREMSGLYLQTDAAIEQASTPFRESIIFDPIAPIRGLPPEKLTPQTTPVQSPLGQYGNALIAGVDQALKFSEVTSSGLRFY